MTNEEIKSLWAKAARYARSKGLQDDADDFAQEACMRIIGGRKTGFRLLLIDYIRERYGRAGERGHFAWSNRYVSLSDPELLDVRELECQSSIYSGGQSESERSDWRSRIDIHGRESIIFDLVVLKGWDQRFVAEICEVHESAISLQMRQIEEKTKGAILIQDTWDRYHDDKEYSKLEIDWITI